MIDLDALDDDQRVAATAPRGPVCILAGAGTGKTRTITYRIAHMIDTGFVSPNRVLAVTFTSRAAGEMRHRLGLMGIGGVQARTFHAAARRQLSYFWPQIAGNLPWKLVDNKFPLVGRAVRGAGLENNTDMVRDVLSEIEWAKASLISPDAYPAAVDSSHRTAPADPQKVAQAYRLYEQSKTTPEGMLLDFDDLLVHTAGALESSAAIAEEFRTQYRSFVVDEYQDVTPLQQRVLDAWLGERDDVTVVGDANQTIYSFTGATPNYLLNFSRKYPHASVTRLQRDYRSTPQVTDLANTVIGQATGRVAGTRLTLEGMRPAGPEPTFTSYDDEPAQARGVARRIGQLLQQGVPAREIAVLYRINAHSALFEQALSEENIPYQVRGGEGFYNRPEIRAAITELVRLSGRDDLPEEATGPGLVRLVRAALAPLGLTPTEPEGAQARERWQSLNALAELVEELGTMTGDLTLPGLLGELKTRADAKHPPAVDGVTLASLHAAKGLEWDAVFLVGLSEGSLPIKQAIQAGPEHIEEERRLFYVGITRAREHLHLSWALARQEGARASRNRTRFLDGIVSDPKPVTAAHSSRKQANCRVCGRVLDTPAAKVLGRCESCPGDTDHGLVEHLRQWRKHTAEELGQPAYIVFSDATLLAIAEATPRTPHELLKISGLGPVKLEKFGESLLEALDEYVG
ncbi:ATP-dependent DNA helicase [Corynebacterium sp. 13CS0277]|uniref:ATP-dependent DNA helicase UvrD2 n=1 Tax=Corynebacterium sp. 13CS0277 TaxID=2071994 RepID=UPI000D026307|nr:ATP-dependent DNA helicase UvrD2 [Corynebacterium sp. 13CS0277]PRQ11456.1 ATP-dependent DNA helicase [Corynebacterium sp. 13CS0277]